MWDTLFVGAGCFWGTEAYYKKIKGVVATEVGYANGPVDTVNYEQVCNGSGHAEVVKIALNFKIISLQELFESYIRIVNPFTDNRQGNDIGIQYRPCLYSKDENLLSKIKKELQLWEKINGLSVIEVKFLTFYITAEEYHQSYLSKNTSGYCHINLQSIPLHLKK